MCFDRHTFIIAFCYQCFILVVFILIATCIIYCLVLVNLRKKTNIIIFKKNLLYYSEQVIFIILICFSYRSRKTITMKIVFNKQKDPSDLMFINNMPIKIRQKHLTQQSKTVPSNFEKSP